MPDQNQNTVEPAAPAKPVFHPFAVSIPIKLRADALAAVAGLQAANANPDLLDVAKSAAKDLIELGEDSEKAFDVKIEVGGATARQIMVLVTPHNL